MEHFDLVDWTMQEARQLRAEPQMPGASDSTLSLNGLLEVLEEERVEFEREGTRADRQPT